MVTKERFAQGLTLSQYVDQMSVNRERFVEALDEVTIEPEDARVLERLGAARRVLVITEDWCGTSLAVHAMLRCEFDTEPVPWANDRL